MKTFLTIVLCVLLTSIAAGVRRADKFMGIWMGNNYEALAIIDTAVITNDAVAIFETSGDRHIFHYTLKEDTLEIFSPYLVKGDNLVPFSSDTLSDDYFQPVDSGGFCFIIEHRDLDSLVLRPHRSSTREQFKHTREDDYMFDSTNTITLYPTLKDTLFSFDKLMFCTQYKFRSEYGFTGIYREGEHTDSIYYPPGKLIEEDLRIIIDSTKTMYLYKDKFAMQLYCIYKFGNKNALKQGYYQGCLSDSLYDLLLNVLSTCYLDRMQLRIDFDSTTPEYSLDIYYNDKYKRTVGTDFPLMGTALFKYLSSIDRKVPLVKSKTAKEMFEQFYKKRDN
jgi:hypothetical protein